MLYLKYRVVSSVTSLILEERKHADISFHPKVFGLMSVSWYVVLKIQLRYKLHHELLINSRSAVNIPTQRAFLDYSPCPPLNVCEGLSPPIRYLTLLLRMKQPLVGLQRTVDRCYVSLRNNLFPSAVARAVLITCRRGRAANYPGGRKGYFGRSEGHKLVCSLETQARPVALDGMICSDLGGSWHHSCSKKMFPLFCSLFLCLFCSRTSWVRSYKNVLWLVSVFS